jgi:predicted NUDIX family NTP pyrophosphohydrolase
MRKSSGILLYRFRKKSPEYFLVHHGGPFWKNKDEGAWSIVKGEFTDESPLEAAQREFKEETGTAIDGSFTELTPIKQKAGKLVYAFALEGDIDADAIQSNTFKVQWPPNSGKWQTFPEVDKAAWFSPEEARIRINAAQIAFLDELEALLQKG